VKTNVQVKAPETDKSGDFSPAKAETYSEPAASPLVFDRKSWEDRVRKYTAPFQRYGNIYSAQAQITAQRQTRWFVSSDGASIKTADTSYRLMISAFSKASDGMELPLYESFYSSTNEGLPGDAEVLEKVNKMTKSLMALKLAPVMEPYAGPAIMSPRATGVIFHEIFGHRIEGQREKRENQSQTFRDRVGQQVLPEFISVSEAVLRADQGAARDRQGDHCAGVQVTRDHLSNPEEQMGVRGLSELRAGGGLK
jgi:TldD protein